MGERAGLFVYGGDLEVGVASCLRDAAALKRQHFFRANQSNLWFLKNNKGISAKVSSQLLQSLYNLYRTTSLLVQDE